MIKRWLAGWLAIVMLFAGCAATAESGGTTETTSPEGTASAAEAAADEGGGYTGSSTADIQESMETREGEAPSTLAGNIRLILQMMQNEDVQHMLQIEDVRMVASEVVAKTLKWLLENRPVTMKILAELGVGEDERYCVSEVWDSAERVCNYWDEYRESPDGGQLEEEFILVLEDPDIREAAENFVRLVQSGDLAAILEMINREANDSENDREDDETRWMGSLTRVARERNMNTSTFMGRVMLGLLAVLENSEWAQESLPKLAKNENLWRFILHQAQGNKTLDSILREEIRRLMSDPKIKSFLKNNLEESIRLLKSLSSQPETGEVGTETGAEAHAETTGSLSEKKTGAQSAETVDKEETP